MPTYASSEDLNSFFSSANITDWADKDRDGSLSNEEQQAVDKAIEAAEAIVDSYLKQAGYASPFDSTSFAELPARLQSLIKQWTVVIAGFHIYAWRGMRDKVNPFEKIYTQVIGQLKNIANGASLARISHKKRLFF